MKNQILHVRIISPKEVIFEGEANSVSSKNSRGNFDILPFHANFITLIENQPIFLRSTGEKDIQFTFPIAIIYNRENSVDIYTDIQLSPEPSASDRLSPRVEVSPEPETGPKV